MTKRAANRVACQVRRSLRMYALRFVWVRLVWDNDTIRASQDRPPQWRSVLRTFNFQTLPWRGIATVRGSLHRHNTSRVLHNWFQGSGYLRNKENPRMFVFCLRSVCANLELLKA
jgi:hypothetical protein